MPVDMEYILKLRERRDDALAGEGRFKDVSIEQAYLAAVLCQVAIAHERYYGVADKDLRLPDWWVGGDSIRRW